MAPLNINLAPLGGSRYLTVCQTKIAPFVFVGKLGPPQPRRARHFCTLQEVAEQWQPFKCKKCQYVVSSTSINWINSNKTHENKPFHGWLFHGKIPWKSIDSSPTLVASWHLVSPGSLSVASFAWGVLPREFFFAAFFLQGKKKQVPDLQSIESCSKPLTGLVFSPKKMRRLISAWVKFFLEGLDFGKEPFLGAVFISKNQWDPMATSSWSFDPATSCGQLALEYIIYIYYIYILLGIGSITLSHEFPRLLNPTTPGIVIRFPQCHNIGNLMLGQVCGLLWDPISPELSFGQWQCIYFRVYLYVSNGKSWDVHPNLRPWFSSTSFLVHQKIPSWKISKVQASLPPLHLPACRPLRQTSLLKTSVGSFLNGFEIFGWKQKIPWSWWYDIGTHLWGCGGVG